MGYMTGSFGEVMGTVSGTHIVKDIRGEDCIMATDPDTGEQYQDCTNWGSVFDVGWDDIFNDVEISCWK